MQYAISSDVSEVVCDLIGKLHCRLQQKGAPTYVHEPQCISDVHEEGGLNGGVAYAWGLESGSWSRQGSGSFYCPDETNFPTPIPMHTLPRH